MKEINKLIRKGYKIHEEFIQIKKLMAIEVVKMLPWIEEENYEVHVDWYPGDGFLVNISNRNVEDNYYKSTFIGFGDDALVPLKKFKEGMTKDDVLDISF